MSKLTTLVKEIFLLQMESMGTQSFSQILLRGGMFKLPWRNKCPISELKVFHYRCCFHIR